MTRLIRLLFILLLFLGVVGKVKAQDSNLFSYPNSIRYAKFLFETSQFALSGLEYERCFITDSSENTLEQIFKCYLLAKKFDNATFRYNQLGNRFQSIPQIAVLQARLLLESGNLNHFSSFIEKDKVIDSSTKTKLTSLGFAYGHQWEEMKLATLALEDFAQQRSLLSLHESGIRTKFKKPWLSSLLSIPFPGLGRVYSGYWKDGLVSLSIVSTTAWQSVVGFRKNGISSVYGWIFGALGTGFYVGNIYGSYRAAEKRNAVLNQKLKDETDRVYALMFP